MMRAGIISQMDEHTGARYRIATPTAPMLCAPSDDAECVSEYLFGETLIAASSQPEQASKAIDRLSGIQAQTAGEIERPASLDKKWQLLTAERDDYQGFVSTDYLTHLDDLQPASTDQVIDNSSDKHGHVPTHKVCTRSTLLFTRPSIKSRVRLNLPFLSHMVASDKQDAEYANQFIRLDTGEFVWKAHLLPFDSIFTDSAISLAHQHFLGTPYLWGGCSPQGIDCSGLIQVLARAKGIRIPRDSGDQESALMHQVPYAQRRSEDIVYWPGHTAILIDSDAVLHATAHCLSCVVEPLAAVSERAGPISSIKRLFN